MIRLDYLVRQLVKLVPRKENKSYYFAHKSSTSNFSNAAMAMAKAK